MTTSRGSAVLPLIAVVATAALCVGFVVAAGRRPPIALSRHPEAAASASSAPAAELTAARLTRADAAATPDLRAPAAASAEPAAEPTAESAPGLPVEGRVVAADTGQPVAGARVSIWTHDESDIVETDARGAFLHPRFPLDGKLHQLHVEAAGHGSHVVYLRVRASGAWEVPSPLGPAHDAAGTALPAQVLVELPRELVVTGVVVTPRNEPVAGALVAAEGSVILIPRVASRDEAEVMTGADGTFELRGLRADVGHALVVSARGLAETALELPAGEARIDVGRVALDPAALLGGSVLDADGFPVEGIRVHLVSEREPSTPASSVDAAVRVRGAHRFTWTGPEGVFLFEDLPAGVFEVRTRRDAGVLAAETVELLAGETRTEVQLALPADTLTLVGTVRDAAGPVPLASVEIERRGRVGRVTAGVDGTFRIAGLDGDAPYRLLARRPGEERTDPSGEILVSARACAEIVLGGS